MGFRTISLSDQVYRKLKSERRRGESFSDAIERLLAMKQPPLGKYAGAWNPISPQDAAEIRARVERLRHRTPAR